MAVDGGEKGNVFTSARNNYSEFNFFLDPLAAKTVLESTLNVTLIPLSAQRTVNAFPPTLARLEVKKKTPELSFVVKLLSTLNKLQRSSTIYSHVVICR